MPVPQPMRLGSSGIKISPIVVGCMSFGSKDWAEWVIEDKEEVFRLMKHCYDNGLRTFDTADAYSNGESERLLGEFIRRFNIDRETIVILTKIYNPVRKGLRIFDKDDADEMTLLDMVNQRGLSRKHIIDGVEKCVQRLGTYIDVLQIHRLDHDTEPAEIMRALNDVVERGWTRYLGASSMLATEFVELQMTAEQHGWFKFSSVQSCYNLLYREDERELIPYAKKHRLALIPWSPVSRGVLTRPLGASTLRSSTDGGMKRIALDNLSEADSEIVTRVENVAQSKGVSMAMVAVAWTIKKGCQPVLGMNKIERIDEAIGALRVSLTDDDIKYLEEPYQPKRYVF